MNRGSVIKALGGVAFAALLVCALNALPGAAGAVEDGVGDPAAGGELPPAVGAPDAAAPAPPPAAAPEGGARRDRRSLRRLRRFGAQPQPDAGAPTPDAGARDAAPLRIATRDGGARPDGAVARFGARDGGLRPPIAFQPPRPPPIVPTPPPPPPQPTGPSTSLPVTDLGFNTCQKVPAGKRSVKMNLKPEVELPELVAWISSITCKSFVLPGHLSAGGKKLTFVTQGTMTPNEAYATFLTALDSIGLTVQRSHGYYTIIETAKAKSGAVPVYGFDGKPAQATPKRTKSPAVGD